MVLPIPSRKNSALLLLLGGAAFQRCGKCFVLNPALAAEVTGFLPGNDFFSAACIPALLPPP
jgi:hypothetical protein